MSNYSFMDVCCVQKQYNAMGASQSVDRVAFWMGLLRPQMRQSIERHDNFARTSVGFGNKVHKFRREILRDNDWIEIARIFVIWGTTPCNAGKGGHKQMTVNKPLNSVLIDHNC